MDNKYELRLFDESLLLFEMTSGAFEALDVSHISVVPKKAELLPMDLLPAEQINPDTLGDWLRRRVIPKNRAFVEEILQSLGLSADNPKGIIDVCKGLSLNDSYWVVPQGFDGTFADCNLYENRFSEMLSLVAYTGAPHGDVVFTTSPELTTDGMLPKAWRFIDRDGIYLYKGGTSGASNTGKEPYSEYYACQIAEHMGIHAVHYDLENWKEILASKCKLFTDIDTAYVPIYRIVKNSSLAAVVRYYDRQGQTFADSIRDMLVFDALIYNEDRHFNNFGVLRDNHSGKVIAPAPVFDNGNALFNFASKDSYADLDKYALTRSPHPACGAKFESICASAMTPRQAAMLRKMLGFTFARHPKINLPEDNLSAIERHMQKRASQLLSLGSIQSVVPDDTLRSDPV
ncbi:MAG: XRE family transcriptional regulator [Oscillospiraceae bacterium]|jgi:hypothetical protein|nr:XRE family transcriptional regulator [Oscillospiraceae bacterium]